MEKTKPKDFGKQVVSVDNIIITKKLIKDRRNEVMLLFGEIEETNDIVMKEITSYSRLRL